MRGQMLEHGEWSSAANGAPRAKARGELHTARPLVVKWARGEWSAEQPLSFERVQDLPLPRHERLGQVARRVFAE